MARRRFIAPLRGAVSASRFEHPLFARIEAFSALYAGDCWPSIETMNARLTTGPRGGPALRFVLQSDALLADGLHYESRILERGEIATREENWHDLFNAIAWLRHAALKHALNARQAADVARHGPKWRSPAQDALTQFDEAGCVVLLRDPALLPLWDEHDWRGLFLDQARAWCDGRIEFAVFGHALYEHALVPELLLAAKCLVVQDETIDIESAVDVAAASITHADALRHPSELRPLPLSGIPGWHGQTGSAHFYETAPCFRSRRADRRYPAAIRQRRI